MSVPFVHSNYKRKEGDFYPTIDKRCIYAFLEHFTPGKCVDVCAPDGSGIVDTLNDCGYDAIGLPDAFPRTVKTKWIITNPPYSRPLVDKIINRQIERIAESQIYGLAVLLRSTFDHAKSRIDMFANNPFYAGQIKLMFRPWWSESREKQPIHNYVWQIWTADAFGGSPFIWYASGQPPNKQNAGDGLELGFMSQGRFNL